MPLSPDDLKSIASIVVPVGIAVATGGYASYKKLHVDAQQTKQELAIYRATTDAELAALKNGHQEIKSSLARVEDTVVRTRELFLTEFSGLKSSIDSILHPYKPG